MKWLKDMHSASPEVSNPRVWYSTIMLFMLGNMTIAMVQHGLTPEWVDLGKWLLGTVAAGYGITKTAAVVGPK